ncbi:toll/interleukin-1 receptor domain-containing protein [Desulfobacterales bacterium HSG2]|nr:toll/interleukin-1 receptor domain-containing protein [Desulfobacterales bacterium HSG2]
MAFVPGYKHDIFVSYAWVDNKTNDNTYEGWVSTLVKGLENELARLLGRRDFFSLWKDNRKLSGNEPITPEILETLKHTATMVVIMSPGYIASKWCKIERETFLKRADRRPRPNSRIFIIEYGKVEKDEWPTEFRKDILGYRFWVQEGKKAPRTLGFPMPNPKDPNDKPYYDRLNDLSNDMAKELKCLKSLADTPTDKPGTRPAVFLAEVPENLFTEHDEVKRYIDQAGFKVLPVTSLYSTDSDAFKEAVDRELKECGIFIQLLSDMSGKIHPNSPSYVSIQYQQALAAGKPIIQWRNPSLDLDKIEDKAHRELLECDTVLPVNLEEFKSAVERASSKASGIKEGDDIYESINSGWNRGRTFAIILGAKEWPKYPKLNFDNPSALSNPARDIEEYFLDEKGFNLPRDNLLNLFDCDWNPSIIDEEIINFLDNCMSKIEENVKDDCNFCNFIFYYIGHGGFFNNDKDFYLAIRDTNEKNPYSSGIRLKSLATTIKNNARYMRRYIILDCCFSGACVSDFQAGARIFEAFKDSPHAGTTVLCSSSSGTKSSILENEDYTIFSKALYTVLRQGNPEINGDLSLHTVYKLMIGIYETQFNDAPRPEIHPPDQRQGDIASIPLFPNSAHRPTLYIDNTYRRSILTSPKVTSHRGIRDAIQIFFEHEDNNNNLFILYGKTPYFKNAVLVFEQYLNSLKTKHCVVCDMRSIQYKNRADTLFDIIQQISDYLAIKIDKPILKTEWDDTLRELREKRINFQIENIPLEMRFAEFVGFIKYVLPSRIEVILDELGSVIICFKHFEEVGTWNKKMIPKIHDCLLKPLLKESRISILLIISKSNNRPDLFYGPVESSQYEGITYYELKIN